MKIKDVIGISHAKLLVGNLDYEFKHFSKDTRIIQAGDTYIAIRGENFDGNRFFEDAFSKGADTCVLEYVDEELLKKYSDKNILIVDDALEFVMGAAAKKRESIHVPVVAITGSVGKTSTKKIVADVLEKKYQILRTIGNENSRLGLSLRILNYQNEECIVLEMGMNHAGEIGSLTRIAKPDIAVITNVGTSHIGILGSRENILKAKLEILEGLSGPIIVNYDNDLLHEWVLKHEYDQIITFGIHEKADYYAQHISYQASGSDYLLDGEKVHLPIIGDAFIYNSLVAFAVADLLHVDHDMVKEVLNYLELEPHRMNIIPVRDFTIIDDSYNASYDSIQSALGVLDTFSGRKIAILGDIFELGDYSEEIHRKLGKLVCEHKVDVLITVGKEAQFINEEAKNRGFVKESSYHFDSNQEVITFLHEIVQTGDVLLFKASHAMDFIPMIEEFKKKYE